MRLQNAILPQEDQLRFFQLFYGIKSPFNMLVEAAKIVIPCHTNNAVF